jgi:hypothetical protein
VRRPLEPTSLYDDLSSQGKRPLTRVLSLEVGAGAGAPMLTMRRTTFDDAGRAVEYGTHLYRASIYSFEFVLVNR